jgi:hypothetical protein
MTSTQKKMRYDMVEVENRLNCLLSRPPTRFSSSYVRYWCSIEQKHKIVRIKEFILCGLNSYFEKK